MAIHPNSFVIDALADPQMRILLRQEHLYIENRFYLHNAILGNHTSLPCMFPMYLT